MNKIKKFVKSPLFVIILFVIAAGLIAVSSISGARAALTYSAVYSSQLELFDIGVTLTENEKGVSNRDYVAYSDNEWNDSGEGILLSHLPKDDFKIGTSYEERIACQNTGSIDEYVRIVVYKYWLKADGETKETGLSPDMIDLHLTGNGWVVDEAATTGERIVLYYTRPLAVGESAPALSDTITISSDIARGVSQTVEKTAAGTVITTTYDYDGVNFVLEAEVDAVQTHNAQHAIMSAWGRSVTIAADGTLSLN